MVFLLPVLITGCFRRDIKKMLMTYYSQEVKFPSQLIKVPGTSMNIHSINDSIPKLVIYIDSTECSSCRIGHLEEYETLATESNITDRFALIIILSPSKKDFEYTKHLLDVYNFPFTVYLDKAHSFRKENTFIPNDKRFHAFFVNAKNQPVLVGDPTHGAKIQHLFKKTLSETL